MNAAYRRHAPGPILRWLDALRWRVAVLVAPEIDVAHGKRRLEGIARECGVSNAMSKKIAAIFFDGSRTRLTKDTR